MAVVDQAESTEHQIASHLHCFKKYVFVVGRKEIDKTNHQYTVSTIGRYCHPFFHLPDCLTRYPFIQSIE